MILVITKETELEINGNSSYKLRLNIYLMSGSSVMTVIYRHFSKVSSTLLES